MYIDEYKAPLKKKNTQVAGFVKNYFQINNINYMHSYTFHIGNAITYRNFYSYCIRSKAKEFLKFTKPFYYHSKKKK